MSSSNSCIPSQLIHREVTGDAEFSQGGTTQKSLDTPADFLIQAGGRAVSEGGNSSRDVKNVFI